MMESINSYLILTACLFLLFLLVTFLADRYRTKIQSFFTKQSRFSTKIPWNTISKIFCLWAVILFSRKLLYYVPFFRVIQTKDAIWCMDKYIFFFIFGLLIFLLVFYKKMESESVKEKTFIFPILFFVFLFLWILPDIIYAVLEGKLDELSGISILIKPFLLLKMLCSGKYLGLLVSGVLAYYLLEGRKNITIKKPAAKFFIISGLLLSFAVLSYFRFVLEWERKSSLELHNARTAKNIRALEDLVDAAHLKKDNIMKFRALNAIAEVTRERGNIIYSREMFQQAIDTGKNIQNKQAKYNALKEIALAIAKGGDSQWAESIAAKIPDYEGYLKKSLLKEIREKIEKK